MSAFGVSLQVRVGVNTGEVVVGTEERLATGDAVNVAARLEQAAAPGEILLGEETFRLARHALVVEPVAPVAAKGKADPIIARRLLGVREGAEPFERRFDAPFVGRARSSTAFAVRSSKRSPTGVAGSSPSSARLASGRRGLPVKSRRSSVTGPSC